MRIYIIDYKLPTKTSAVMCVGMLSSSQDRALFWCPWSFHCTCLRSFDSDTANHHRCNQLNNALIYHPSTAAHIIVIIPIKYCCLSFLAFHNYIQCNMIMNHTRDICWVSSIIFETMLMLSSTIRNWQSYISSTPSHFITMVIEVRSSSLLASILLRAAAAPVASNGAGDGDKTHKDRTPDDNSLTLLRWILHPAASGIGGSIHDICNSESEHFVDKTIIALTYPSRKDECRLSHGRDKLISFNHHY